MTTLSDASRGTAVGASGIARRRRRPRVGSVGSRAAYAYVAPFFVLFAAFGLYPLVYTGWVSLHNVNLENLHHSTWVGLHYYKALWSNHFFLNALRNTVTIGIISTVPQLCMALGLAHLLNYKMRGRTFFRVAMLMPYATSVVAGTLIFAELFGRDYGLINWVLHFFGVGHVNWTNGNHWQSQLAISAIVTWRWTGYNALIYLAGMQSISTDLYEAAAIDGANRWQQFWSVTVPSLRPTIVFTIVVSTIGAMQMFAEPYLFAGDGTTNGGGQHQYQTLALFMYQQGWTNFHLGQAAATAWTMLLLIVILVSGNAALARGRARRNLGVTS
jgi:cellobiose transport system permease protein